MTTHFLSNNTRQKVIGELSRMELDEPCKLIIKACSQRSAEQNDKIQALCGDFDKQVSFVPSWNTWHNDKKIPHKVESKKVGKDNWRHLLMAGFVQAESMPGLEPRQVVCFYPSTTSLSLKRGSDFIEYIYSVGADYDVEWSE